MSTFESFFEEYYNNLDKEIKSPRLIIKNKIIKLIYNIFANADTDLKNSINNFSEKFSVLFIINISTDIEKSCFNATIQISKKVDWKNVLQFATFFRNFSNFAPCLNI